MLPRNACVLACLLAAIVAGCGTESQTAISNPPADKPTEIAVPAQDSSDTPEPIAAPVESESPTVATRPPDAGQPKMTSPPESPIAPVSLDAVVENPSEKQGGSLEDQLASLEVPQPWVAEVDTKWDVANRPWKDGRIEIRRLLGIETEQSRREAIKLTWDYLQKGDIGNGHEYGMYLFLGNEPVWAVKVFREELSHPDSEFEYPPYFAANALASLYSDFGEFNEAEKVLLRASRWVPPLPSGQFAKPGTDWEEVRQAESHDSLGDLYARWGKTDRALEHYRDAVRIFPTGNPPYGKHELPRKAAKVQAKIDLIEGGSLADASLKDGTYKATAIGYSGDVKVSVQVAGGKVADIQIEHKEKIEQNATKIIPDRIIEQQSLNVDGVSGATVTKDAIISGMLDALRKAGL